MTGLPPDWSAFLGVLAGLLVLALILSWWFEDAP